MQGMTTQAPATPAAKPALIALKPFEAMLPGTFTATDQSQWTFTAQDLADIAASYSPATFAAPLVVGHPKTDSPAYGHAEAMSFDGRVLKVERARCTPEFARAAIEEKRFNKISVALFAANDPANPAPGKYYVRHVGFLGGAAPAMPALKPVELAAGDGGLTIEFAAPTFGYDDHLTARLLRGLRDWLIGKFGQDEAEKALPGWDVGALADMAVQPEDNLSPGPAYAAPGPRGGGTTIQPEGAMPDVEPQAALAAKDAEIARLNAALKAQAQAQQRAEFAAFAEGLKQGGQLLPGQVEVATEMLVALSVSDAKPTFSASGGSEGKTLVQAAQALLSALPKQVTTGHLPKGQPAQAEALPQFAAPHNASVTAEDAETHRKALDYQASHPGTSYVAAWQAVGGK